MLAGLGAIVLGCIVAPAVMVTQIIAEYNSGYAPQSFTLFFVVPVGAFIFGALCSSGVYLGLRFGNARPNIIHILLSFLIGVIGFIINDVLFYTLSSDTSFISYLQNTIDH